MKNTLEAILRGSEPTGLVAGLRSSMKRAALYGSALVVMMAVAGSPTPAQADPCSASTSALVSRSAGGTCGTALALNQEITLQYRVTNASIVDDPGGPNDGLQVAAVMPAGKSLVATLAQETAGVGATELPGTLTFLPVCSSDSAGGSLAAGDPCDPSLSQCGTGTCGCAVRLAGVTCTQNANPNKITLNVGSDLSFAAGQLRTLATIRVKVTGTVDPPVTCGEFFTRMDSTGDVLVTDDALCDNPVTAGAQASANLNAPECVVDSDCGDPQCNECVNVGTDNQCAPRAADTPCGPDSEPNDCVLPACVINASNVGVCTQGVLDAAAGTSCSVEGGNPVPTVECQMPQCDAGGTCANVPDPSQDNDPCGTDANATDCKAPACQAGVCSQEVLDLPPGGTCDNNGGVPVPTEECQVPQCDAGGTCANVPDPSQDNDPCGTDANVTDCKAPACQSGVCNQDVLDLPPGGTCDNNGGVPVPTEECQVPQCDAGGICANVADPSQDNDPCGTDANTTDCKTPACQSGVCNQEVLDLPAGGTCDNNGGVPVPTVECQAPQCDAAGVCANVPDPSQANQPCLDTDPNNCHEAACDASGSCDQDAFCAPQENPTLCQVTISNYIWDDSNMDGLQDAGEVGIANVQVDAYTCDVNGKISLVGSSTTDVNGLYSVTYATCNASEDLLIDVSGNFAGPLSGFSPSLGFCDAANPGNPAACGTEVSAPVDSNCGVTGTAGQSDCRTILRGQTDETVDCGFFTAGCVCQGGGGVPGNFPDPIFGLGAAGTFSVLQMGAASVSITGPYGGIFGDVGVNEGGKLQISGSQQINGTIYADDGGANIGNGLPFVVTDLGPAVAAATAASSALASQPCDVVMPSLDATQTILATHNGLNVICVGSVNLNQKIVTLDNNGFAASFVFNVGCAPSEKGGFKTSQGKILVSGALQPSSVLYNVCHGDVAFSGGGGGCGCCKAAIDGTLLAPTSKVALSPGLVRGGAVMASKSISIVSGSEVTCPPECPKTPICQ